VDYPGNGSFGFDTNCNLFHFKELEVKMSQRQYPEQFFGEVDSKFLYFGIIVIGIIACVSIVAIVKWGK